MDATTFALPDALLEREHEVKRIGAALRSAGQRAGRAVIVEGAAGLGKSRLLEEARRQAPGLGVCSLSARATELEQGFPYGVMRQLFERRLLEAGAAERDRWLAGAAALAADVLIAAPAQASRGATAGAPPGDPGYAWQHGLYWLASNLSADSPLVLIVDDLQWCDAPSARALAFVARRLDGLPLGLILATRPLDAELNPAAATLVADPDAELLRPAPLTETAIAAMAADRLAGEPDDSFVRACRDVTGGNPFLLGELLSEAAARGLAPAAAAAAEVGAMVPRGVANAVLLRLARLPPPAAALARALSTLGDGAHVRDAARLAGLAGAELETAMAALVSAGIVESGRHGPVHPSDAPRGDLRRPVARREGAAAPGRSKDSAPARCPGGPNRGARHVHRAGRKHSGGDAAASRRPRRTGLGRRRRRRRVTCPRPR
jgi:hypothetical protein